uniref:Ig-like domain-containing protein n=1 Tax=Sinocyclocheilus rhinocerous TaxID=307959 RepID=A0A673JNT8_9TELE
MDLNCLLFICSFIRLSGETNYTSIRTVYLQIHMPYSAQDITTVRQISVRRGQSVIIPCLYNQKYAFSCKYLSTGYYWLLSDYVEFPDQRFHHKTVFISDDTSRHSFTVRMDNVQESGYYWCAIHIPSAFDKRARLLVNSQNVTGSENGSVTISCYHQGVQYGVKWCKFGGQCITGASGRLDGASVEIRYGLRNTTVSMSRLKKEHTGWYCCSTEELQMPVHITVHQKKSRESPDTAESDQISSLYSIKCWVVSIQLWVKYGLTQLLGKKIKFKHLIKKLNNWVSQYLTQSWVETTQNFIECWFADKCNKILIFLLCILFGCFYLFLHFIFIYL